MRFWTFTCVLLGLACCVVTPLSEKPYGERTKQAYLEWRSGKSLDVDPLVKI